MSVCACICVRSERLRQENPGHCAAVTPQNQCDRPADWLEGPVSLHLIPQGRPSARPAALVSVCVHVCVRMCVCVCGCISACMCVFLHLIPQDRPKAMGRGISAVTGGQASMCVWVRERERERALV